MGSIDLLDRRVMTAPEAARQLGILATTLIRWLEGEHRGGKWSSRRPRSRARPESE